MRLTMTLTLDGLVRALKWRAHALAEPEAGGYARPREPHPGSMEGRRARPDRDGREGGTDDVAGR